MRVSEYRVFGVQLVILYSLAEQHGLSRHLVLTVDVTAVTVIVSYTARYTQSVKLNTGRAHGPCAWSLNTGRVPRVVCIEVKSVRRCKFF